MDDLEQRYRAARQYADEARRAWDAYKFTPGLDAGRSNALYQAYSQAENKAFALQNEWQKYQSVQKQQAANDAEAAYRQQRAREQEEYDLQQRRDRAEWEEAQRRRQATDQACQASATWTRAPAPQAKAPATM